MRRLATSALIQYPSLLSEVDLTPAHFGQQKLLWQLVKTIPEVHDRDPTGAVSDGVLCALAGVEDEIVTELLRRRFHSQDAARKAVHNLLSEHAEEEVRSRMRWLSDVPGMDLRGELEAMLGTLDAQEDSSTIFTLEDLLAQELAVMEDGKEEDGLIKTGIPSLDKAINGFLPGELIVVASQTGVGKTTLAIHMIRRLARRGIHSAFFSGEMSDTQIRKKTSHAESGVAMDDKLEAAQLQAALENLRETGAGKRCFFDFSTSKTPEQISATIRRLKEHHGIGIAFYDHLRHIDVKSTGNQYAKMSDTVNAAKEIALRENIPFVVLTHFSRGRAVESSRPDREMVRDSGVIGEVADTMICPWKKDKESLTTELWVLKARMTGNQDRKVCDLLFDPARQEFEEVTDVWEDPDRAGDVVDESWAG